MQCVLCAGIYKVENHKCGVTGCRSKVGKMYIHIKLKFANCGENHQATAFKCPARLLNVWFKCPARLKTQAGAQNKKLKKFKAKDKPSATDQVFEEVLALGPRSIELDTKVISYTRDLEKESFRLSSLENNMSEDSTQLIMLVV